jgi:hypothetical protein
VAREAAGNEHEILALMRPITMIEFCVIAVLIACLALHFAVQAEEPPPATPKDWALQQAIAAQTIPETPQCYQARWKHGRFYLMCISEAEWVRQHAEESAAAKKSRAEW